MLGLPDAKQIVAFLTLFEASVRSLFSQDVKGRTMAAFKRRVVAIAFVAFGIARADDGEAAATAQWTIEAPGPLVLRLIAWRMTARDVRRQRDVRAGPGATAQAVPGSWAEKGPSPSPDSQGILLARIATVCLTIVSFIRRLWQLQSLGTWRSTV